MAVRSAVLGTAIWICVAVPAGAQTPLTVGAGGDFPDWGSAIAGIAPLGGPTILEGLPGQTILESAGVFIGGGLGTSAVNTLELRGAPNFSHTIDGGGSAFSIFNISGAPFVSVRNLRFINPAGSSINVSVSTNVVIDNNRLDSQVGAAECIIVEAGSDNSIVRNNRINAGGANEGIHIGAQNMTLENNLVFGYSSAGILVHNNTPDFPIIRHNTLSGFGDGIFFFRDLDATSVVGAQVQNNIIVCESVAFCLRNDDPGFFAAVLSFSNFNLFFTPAGGSVSDDNGVNNITLAMHQAVTSQDANSLQTNPLFVAPGSGDFHLQSPFGSFNDSTGMFDIFSASLSPAVDAANPASPFGNEPPLNGGRANLGAFGNTPFASRSGLPGAAPQLVCLRPIGVSTSGGARVRLFGANIGGATAVNLGASFPSIDATGSGLSGVNNDILDFTMPAMPGGQKFVQVVTSGGADEIRNALTVSGSVATVSHGVLAGNTIQSYQMKSVPLFGSARDILSQLEACLGLYSPFVWRAFIWDSELQQFAELPALVGRDPDRDLSGGGLFVISTTEGTCSFTGLSTEPASNFYVCLRQGWNMISLPSTGQISWNAVRVGVKGEGSTGANDVPADQPNTFAFEMPFFYLGGSYVTVTQLMESESYWVFCKVPAAVLFMNDPSPKAGDPGTQTYGTPPAGAPTPPGPPGSVDSSFSADPIATGGGGGGGGGDTATQVDPADLPIWTGAMLAAMLLTVWIRTRTARVPRS